MAGRKMLFAALWVLCGLSLHINAADAQQFRRTISIPAHALSISPSGTIITPNSLGLQWQHNFRQVARFFIQSPPDYAGGDVTLSIFFQTTSATLGIVDFFIRPNSFNSGEGFRDIDSLSTSGLSVAGREGSGTLYEQRIPIPADRLTGNWWTSGIQREGSDSTYTDDVIVLSVALEYPVN
ncbi:hypothetical protein [Candidatus Entotheonella palauensis]|uniref:hypothetical protein n=1 Tax=Candidatus Entotheonella palauensis TaxID=93172 RepID=UPI001178025F|nr:hypothetical protein [Candidatus Entotheonella palauensis]